MVRGNPPDHAVAEPAICLGGIGVLKPREAIADLLVELDEVRSAAVAEFVSAVGGCAVGDAFCGLGVGVAEGVRLDEGVSESDYATSSVGQMKTATYDLFQAAFLSEVHVILENVVVSRVFSALDGLVRLKKSFPSSGWVTPSST